MSDISPTNQRRTTVFDCGLHRGLSNKKGARCPICTTTDNQECSHCEDSGIEDKPTAAYKKLLDLERRVFDQMEYLAECVNTLGLSETQYIAVMTRADRAARRALKSALNF